MHIRAPEAAHRREPGRPDADLTSGSVPTPPAPSHRPAPPGPSALHPPPGASAGNCRGTGLRHRGTAAATYAGEPLSPAPAPSNPAGTRPYGQPTDDAAPDGRPRRSARRRGRRHCIGLPYRRACTDGPAPEAATRATPQPSDGPDQRSRSSLHPLDRTPPPRKPTGCRPGTHGRAVCRDAADSAPVSDAPSPNAESASRTAPRSLAAPGVSPARGRRGSDAANGTLCPCSSPTASPPPER